MKYSYLSIAKLFPVALLSIAIVFQIAYADTTVSTSSGGSIQTNLGYNIKLNENSSLQRGWGALHDDQMAAELSGTPGVTTTYVSGTRGGYRYESNYSILVREPIVAIEVRFITFDVWGDRTRALSATDIRDFSPGTYRLDATWNLFSENEASEYYASIGYVAMVRTADGQIHVADTEAVTETARNYMSDFTSDLLEESAEN